MPQSQNDAGAQIRFEIGVLLHNFAHQSKQSIRIIIRFDIDVDFDVLAFLSHQEIRQLLERGDLLDRFFDCDDVFNVAVVGLLPNQSLSVRRSFQRGVVEHDDHIIRGDVDVWKVEPVSWLLSTPCCYDGAKSCLPHSVRHAIASDAQFRLTALDSLGAIQNGALEGSQCVFRKRARCL